MSGRWFSLPCLLRWQSVLFLVFGLILVLTPDDAPLSDIYAQSILWITLIILILGGISAFLHLGNPYRAGHAISNFRRSWLSREGISSGLFSFLVLLMLIAQFSSLDFGVVNILLFILAFLCGLVLIYSISRPIHAPHSAGLE